MLRRVCLFLFSFGFSFLSAGVLRGCSEGFCLVLGLFVGGWGLLWGVIVLGGTRKDFCLSCANRCALSQSLRIMSITIFYFFCRPKTTDTTDAEPKSGKQGFRNGISEEKTFYAPARPAADDLEFNHECTRIDTNVRGQFAATLVCDA